MDPPKYATKIFSSSICTIVEAWQLLKGALPAGNTNSSFTMLQPDNTFAVMLIMFSVFS
uniref:Uncharacterized protein n=1 Tax=Arundo donax TaxID=35708 RepID=A0A0A9GGG4_ARUDO